METYKIIDMLCKGNPDAYAVIKIRNKWFVICLWI